MSFRPPLPFDELLQFRVQPAGNGNLNRMFHLDTLSPVVTELSDKHQTVREVSLNPPAREPRGLGKAGQLRARETFQHGAPELRGNQWRSTSAMTTARLAIRANPARSCAASSREK